MDEHGSIMRVEALATDAGLSVDTIRYYQKLGLLHPPERKGRVALYNASHLERLGTIRRLSDEGFSLSQIERLLEGENDPLFGALQDADRTVSFDELVALSGFPGEIVELAIDAGLVRPVPTDTGRFDTEAVSMLTAGSALLSAGLPLEELLDIAMRHAESVEAVVDDAIELFQRHLEPGDRDSRADTVGTLIPLVSDLVAGHFRQTLVDRASARILGNDGPLGGQPDGDSGPRVRISATRTRVDDVDPLAVFNAAEGLERSFWSVPSEGLMIAAVGSAFTATAEGFADRFAEISAAIGGLDLEVTGDDGPPEAGPLLLGGFSFADRAIDRDPDWDDFGPARLVMPQLMVARTSAGCFVTRCGEPQLEHLVSAKYDSTELGPITAVDHRQDREYERLVAAAVAAIEAGQFDKVVTARSLTLDADLDATVVLSRLCERYPDCAVFAIGAGDQLFLGASPERLVARAGTSVRTTALAGSRPRDEDPEKDAAHRAELLASPKERTEHDIVVDDIRSTLRSAGVELDPDVETDVLRLRRIQHLFTPISGQLTEVASTLDLVEALHPTPAVAGLPRRASQDWIDKNESFERGWYAAPVGWTTPDGTGEFRVALRSAILSPDNITLFAGAGIVNGSVPEQELAETAVKFEALLGALGVTP
ncbi:MAG: menaquinone-specific isochorismate synthase [Candidatus Poriferisodalaceae bacterium]